MSHTAGSAEDLFELIFLMRQGSERFRSRVHAEPAVLVLLLL